MHRARRNFLIATLAGAAATTAAAGTWVGRSRHRAARFFRELIRESQRPIQPAAARPDPGAWDPNDITIAWLGHATTLINFHGITVLVDPVLGDRIGIDLGLGVLGPKRFIAPALRASELPPADVVLLTHAHMDHMDFPTLRRIPQPALAVTAHATADLLTGSRVETAEELRWGEATRFKSSDGDLRIEAFEVKHWGARYGKDRHRGYNGYILSRNGRKLLLGGDTAMTPLFADLKGRGPFEAAVMPIAAYRPWIRNHCTPEEALRMANEAGANYVVPVHHSTYKLSDEPMNEPMERMRAVLEGESERLALEQVGETFAIDARGRGRRLARG